MTARWQRAWAEQDARWSVLLVVLFALAASASGLGNLFAYDDIPIIVENPMVTQLHSPAAYLTDSYWGPSRGNSLYRPLTVIASFKREMPRRGRGMFGGVFGGDGEVAG